MNVRNMTHEQRGIYISMLALAWDSEEPGTITLSDQQICRELGIFRRTLERLLADFPATWHRVGGKLVQPKLHEQWTKYQQYQQKMSAMAMRRHHPQQCPATASASATASANIKPKKAAQDENRPSPVLAYSGVHLKITQRQDALLAGAFPWVNRQPEYSKADSWIEANPNRKAKSPSRFMHNWFSRIEIPGGKNERLTAEEAFRRNVETFKKHNLEKPN